MPPQISTKIYIGNLPETCRRVELQKMFELYGKVIECDIVRNYAFVVSHIVPNRLYIVFLFYLYKEVEKARLK